MALAPSVLHSVEHLGLRCGTQSLAWPTALTPLTALIPRVGSHNLHAGSGNLLLPQWKSGGCTCEVAHVGKPRQLTIPTPHQQSHHRSLFVLHSLDQQCSQKFNHV